MPSLATSRRHYSPDIMASAYPPESPLKDTPSSLLNFDDHPHYINSDSDQLLFGPIDFENDHYPITTTSYSWDSFGDIDSEAKSSYNFAGSPAVAPSYEFTLSQPSPPDSYYDPGIHDQDDIHSSPSFDGNVYLGTWVNDPDISAIPASSSPIPIPSSSNTTAFISFPSQSHFPRDSAFSPTSYAALHPLPRSISPSSPFEDNSHITSISPNDTALHTPSWAAQLWDGPSSLRTPPQTRSSVRHSPLTDSTIRPRVTTRRSSVNSAQLFQSSSAPSVTESRVSGQLRSYSRRAESVSVSDDRDATVRRKKRLPPSSDEAAPAEKSHDSPLKSVLHPPKLAPSAWQLYFTDWIQRQQATSTRKLNVAQAAKEAGQEYACLSAEEKEPYKRMSQAAKEARERELSAYMRSLTPDDIKRENAFRAAQRKAGKSRKSNIKDPNAPKKPLKIFGDETETTKQSVLAAAKWRSMTDAERQPFLAQAEQEKMEYEAARRLYEEGATAYGTSINFSILPGSPAFPHVKLESESESEGFTTDDSNARKQ